MFVNCWGGIWPKKRKVRWVEEDFLYLFDAETLETGTPPEDVVSEDASDAYEIVDLWGDQGKGLRKKPANTATKRALFNTYQTFEVDVKATYYFYMTNTSAFMFAFGTNVLVSANTGWRVVGLTRDAWTGHALHNGWRANTNAEFLTSDGWMTDLDEWGIAYKVPMATGVLYMLEVRRNPVSWRQTMRLSEDLWETRYNTCEQQNALAQNRVGFLDGIWMAWQVHLKRVEVLPL